MPAEALRSLSAGDDWIRQELRVIIPARPLAVREALMSTMGGLEGFGIAQADLDNIQLVLAEILNNVAEHAYPGEVEGIVELRVLREGGRITAEVIDAGRPMPGGILPDPALTDTADPLEAAEGGFGWFLIRELSEDLWYRRENGRNNLGVSLKLDHAIRPM